MYTRRILQLLLRNSATRSSFFVQTARRYASASASAPRQPSRWPRRLLYATIFGSLGVAGGSFLTQTRLSAPPIPGSDEDQRTMQRIERLFDIRVPIVQELRKNPDYVEKGVYGNFEEENKAHRLTSGPLAGSRGLALQRNFVNDKEKKIISVVYFGTGLEGWPGMVHGGALGTVIDENLGRAAIRHFPARTGVTANLDINYRAPVNSERFYTLHTTLDQDRSTDRKAFTKCEVRDLSGRLRVEATGIFAVPKRFQLQEVGEHF